MTIFEFVKATGIPDSSDPEKPVTCMIFDYYLVIYTGVIAPNKKGKVFFEDCEFARIRHFPASENVTSVLAYAFRYVYREGRAVGVSDMKKQFRDLLDID